MANPEHLKILQQGVDVWNAWRAKDRSIVPDLSAENLRAERLGGANFANANLSNAHLRDVSLARANLSSATLTRAGLIEADLSHANLSRADLEGANLNYARARGADFAEAKLRGADLRQASLIAATFDHADLRGAKLEGANFVSSILYQANLLGADCSGASFNGALLVEANLSKANLTRTNLYGAVLIGTNLTDAILTGCRVHGISAWNVKVSEGTKQRDLIVTAEGEPEVTVDNIEVAQFVYLLLHNEKIRDVIDTVGRKGVLLLGRFTDGRIAILERLREALRQRGYVPIVFNFDKPETKDFTETVRLLAGLAKFVIADITNPKSSPLELQATVPEIMVPFQPIIEQGEKPFSMLQDLQRKHDWVFKTLRYSSLDLLIETLDDEVIKPAEAKFKELLARRAEGIEDRLV